MRFTLSNFSDSDDRTGEVCELYGSTILEIPDIIVSKARRIIQRAVKAQLNGASSDTLAGILSEFRAYPISRRRSDPFELYYDDSDYDCICSSANVYADLDYDGSPRLAVDFEVEYCSLYYDDDDEVTNYGEYDETDYITIDLTREILSKAFLGADFRDSAAMVFTFNVPAKKDEVNDSEATAT
jgi:hypothetical protein